MRAARYLQPPPSTLNGPVETDDIPATDPVASAIADPVPEQGTGSDDVQDGHSTSPLPMIDPAEIDVSDWEVTGTDF
jgi:hypothetical protein